MKHTITMKHIITLFTALLLAPLAALQAQSPQKESDAGTAFLLSAETEESRLRDAVGAMRAPDAARRFYILEGANPDDIMTALRYFGERREAMKNVVDVRLLRDQGALGMAKRANGVPLPLLVAAIRDVPVASLALPAAADAVTRFVEAGQATAVILECGEMGARSPSADAGFPVLYGEVTTHDGNRLTRSPQGLSVLKGGYTRSLVTLRFALDGQVKPGEYDVWPGFTLGGIGHQQFTVRAGADANDLMTRVVFGQGNAESWVASWQKGRPIRIYPQDRFLEITVQGMQTDQKILDDFILVQRAPMPEGLTEESSAWRVAVEGFKATAPKRRIWILEGAQAADSDPFYRQLAALPRNLQDACAASIFLGAEAESLARQTGTDRRPALMVLDDRYALRGVLSAPATADQVTAFLASATAGGPAPGPFPTRPAVAQAASKPVDKGIVPEWLTVSGWSGPAGLALWGLEAEARTRPNPGDPCAVSRFDSNLAKNWTVTAGSDGGLVVLESKSGDYTWARGVGYGNVYLEAERGMDCVLHLAHTGIGTAGWLDGRPLVFDRDPAPPADFARLQELQPSSGGTSTGVTDQGNKIEVRLGHSVAPQAAPLSLKAGRNRLLLKLITQKPGGQVFAFAARLMDAEGKAPAGLLAQVSDPDCALDIEATARRLTQRVTVDAPANLPRAGEPLKLKYELRLEGDTDLPVAPFDARLVLEITDYDGREVMRRETTHRFPGAVEFDLGKAPARGYYAVLPALYTPDGTLIMNGVPDGFSVIGGTAAQSARRERKKMAVTNYFMGTGEGAEYQTAFPWMTRMGIYRNIGSNPEWPIELAEAAQADEITLTMDFWDIHNSYTQAYRDELAKRAAPYTRYFKSFNEVDIHPTVRGTPERWVARTRGEYEAVKAVRPDSVYVGGSLVRPGSDDWFTECLKLGLDRYIDVWDVHCYPQRPPVLEGSMANSPNETERGVETCYKRLGRSNDKPFWIGETGARCSHGHDARRWQADTVAKMIACTLSREDFHYIAFLVPWMASHAGTHAGPSAGAFDIPTAHMPGEAAYYTASALIDGFDYVRLDLGPDIQAARFGETIMLWSTGAEHDVVLPLDNQEPRVRVDVVGRVRDLTVPPDGQAAIRVTQSPVYVLTREAYERLTD